LSARTLNRKRGKHKPIFDYFFRLFLVAAGTPVNPDIRLTPAKTLFLWAKRPKRCIFDGYFR
jgi:hypothetical protein